MKSHWHDSLSSARISLVVLVVLVTLLLAIPAYASPQDLPPRPTLPPAPEPTAVPVLRGGWIQVQVADLQAQSLVVQWQDNTGAWNTVESWRGNFDTTIDGIAVKTWWVSDQLFGAGPFRWVVYDGSSQVVGESKPFNMPGENKQTVTVTVSP